MAGWQIIGPSSTFRLRGWEAASGTAITATPCRRSEASASTILQSLSDAGTLMNSNNNNDDDNNKKKKNRWPSIEASAEQTSYSALLHCNDRNADC